MTTKNTEQDTAINDTNIAKWKKENATGIYEVTTNDKKFSAVFRNPTLQDLDAAKVDITEDTSLQFFIGVGRETFLGGSREVFENEKYQNDFKATVMEKAEGKKMALVEL